MWLSNGGSLDRPVGALTTIRGAILLVLVGAGAVGVFLGFGMRGVAIYFLAAVLPGLVLVHVLISGIGSWRRAKTSMLDPVAGTMLVTGCGGDPTEAMYARSVLTGVLAAPGVAAMAVSHKGIVRTSKWPAPGLTLPVVIDRADPRRFRIEWKKVGSRQQLAVHQAEQIATQMRMGSNGQTLLADGVPAGLPVLPLENANLDELRAALRLNGMSGRVIVNQARPGAPLDDGQQFHLDGWLQMDDGQSVVLRDVTVAVRADHVAKVTPGRVVPTRTALVNGVVTTVYQWELG